MRALREDERDEIESVKHFLKYINSNSNVHPFEIWEGMMKVKDITEKYIVSEIASEEELSELIEVDDIKDVLFKLLALLKKHLKDKEDGNIKT